MLKNVIFRTYGFRRLHAGPPTEYIYKREVVPSDLDGTKLKNKFDCENDKWTDEIIYSGKNLYYPKYGSSIYDDHIMKERWERLNSRED